MNQFLYINLLKTKYNLLYVRNQPPLEDEDLLEDDDLTLDDDELSDDDLLLDELLRVLLLEDDELFLVGLVPTRVPEELLEEDELLDGVVPTRDPVDVPDDVREGDVELPLDGIVPTRDPLVDVLDGAVLMRDPVEVVAPPRDGRVLIVVDDRPLPGLEVLTTDGLPPPLPALMDEPRYTVGRP